MNIRHYLCALLCLLSAAGCSDEKTPSLDYTAIDELIAECTQLHDSAEEGEELGEYVKGSKDIFQKSIDETSYVRNNTDRQSALDNYCEKLATARDVFGGSKVSPACPLFDGTGYIDCGAAAQFLSANMTVEAWVYINEKTGGSIIGAEGSDANGGLGGLLIRLAEGVDYAIDFCMVNNTWSSCLSGAGSAPHKQWIHIAATFDSENICLYLNGEFASAIKIAPYVPDSDGKFIIGDLALSAAGNSVAKSTTYVSGTRPAPRNRLPRPTTGCLRATRRGWSQTGSSQSKAATISSTLRAATPLRS